MAFIALSVFSLVLCNQQDDKYERAFRQTQLQSYQQILASQNVDTSAQGAFRYLSQLLPNSELEQQIREQIQMLQSRRFRDRESAEKKLASFGPVALKFLKPATSQGDPETRMRAVRALEVINSYSFSLTNAAINVLKFDESKTPTFADRLDLLFDLCRSGMADDIERTLLNAIVQIASKQNRHKIVEGIKDRNRVVRISCVKAIPKCFSNGELDQFKGLIQSDDDFVSMAAIETLGFTMPTESVELAIERHLDSSTIEIQRSAINFLRAVSMEHFGFAVGNSDSDRKAAVNKWKTWLSESRPISASNFERMLANTNLPPSAILISVNGQGVRQYDLNGNLIWKLDGQAYDSQYVGKNVYLVTFRSSGMVKLFRNDKTVATLTGLNSPSDAEYLENGNFLVAHGSGIITEHDSTGEIVNRFDGFSNPFDVDRLANGHTLVADSSNNRIVEVDSTGSVVWECQDLKFPNNVFRLPDGRTLYTTYTSGLIGMVGVDGTRLWEKRIGNGTMYSVYGAKGKIYASDGANRKIWILDLAGEIIGQISVPESFCDVDFVTR